MNALLWNVIAVLLQPIFGAEYFLCMIATYLCCQTHIHFPQRVRLNVCQCEFWDNTQLSLFLLRVQGAVVVVNDVTVASLRKSAGVLSRNSPFTWDCKIPVIT